MATNKEKITASALKYLKTGALDKAVKELEKLLEFEPNDERTLQKIGELYSRLGRAQEAKNAYSRVSEIYVRQGFYLKAIAVVKQMLQFEPNQVDLHQRLAEMYQQLGLLSETIAQYQLLISLYEKQNRPQEALEALRRITSIDADNLPNRIHLAESYIKLGMPNEGFEAYEDALEHLKRLGRQEDYARVLERLVHHAPEKVERTSELARLYYDRGEPKKCLSRLKAVLAHAPTDIDTLTLLGRVFVDLGENDKAATVLHEIARLHSENGREKAANETRRKILALRPQDDAARQALMGSTFGGLSRPETAIRSFRESETALAAVGQAAPEPAPQLLPSPAFERLGANDAAAVTTPDLAPNLTKMMTEATVFSKYGLTAQAKERIEQVLQLAPDKLDALLLAGTVYKALGLNEQGAVASLKVAAAYLESGQAALARELLESVLPLGHHSALAASFLSRLAAEKPAALALELRAALAKGATPPAPVPVVAQPLFEAVVEPQPLAPLEPFIETVDAIPQADILEEEAFELLPQDAITPPARPTTQSIDQSGSVDILFPEALIEDGPAELEAAEAIVEAGAEPDVLPLELPAEPLLLEPDGDSSGEVEEGEGELLDLDGIEDDHRPLEMAADVESGLIELHAHESGILTLPVATPLPADAPEVPPIDPTLFNELLTLSEKDEELAELELEGDEWVDAVSVEETPSAATPLLAAPVPSAMAAAELEFAEPELLVEDDAEPDFAEPELSLEDDLAAAPLAALLSPDQLSDLEEAEFFYAQALYGESLPIYRRLLAAAPRHPHLEQRLHECESQLLLQAPRPLAEPVAKESAPEPPAPPVDAAPEPAPVKVAAAVHPAPATNEIADGSVDLSAEIMASLSVFDDDEAPAVAARTASPQAPISSQSAEDVDTETHFNLGVAYREMGLQNEAIGEFMMARKGRFTPYANALAGLCYIAKGTQAMALDYFLEMLSDDTLTRSLLLALRLELGESENKRGEAAVAMTHFSAALAIDPDCAQARLRLAELGARGVVAASDEVDSLLSSIDPQQLPIGEIQGLKFKAAARNSNSSNVSYL